MGLIIKHCPLSHPILCQSWSPEFSSSVQNIYNLAFFHNTVNERFGILCCLSIYIELGLAVLVKSQDPTGLSNEWTKDVPAQILVEKGMRDMAAGCSTRRGWSKWDKGVEVSIRYDYFLKYRKKSFYMDKRQRAFLKLALKLLCCELL